MSGTLSPMLETSGRLLRMLSLLQSRREWPGPDLASRLGVTERTVRRDVDKLRTLGYPIDATPGVAGGYRLGPGAQLPPLLLDDDEAVAVAVALRTVVSGTVSGIEETSARALAKLVQVLPSRLRRRVAAVSTYTWSLPGTGPVVDAELLSVIAAACRDHEMLRFDYTSFRDVQSQRHVEPTALVHADRRWYVVAWDVDRDDWRTFRLDRIASTPTPGRRFTPRPPPAEDLAVYVERSVTGARGSKLAKVVLHAPLARMTSEVPQLTASLQRVDDERCLMTVGADWFGAIAIYLASTGVDFEILEPPEFVAEISRLADRFSAAAARSREPC
jgi:predicted DNA-binding transcriptional regulator YafY